MEDPRRTIGRHQGMVNTSPSFEEYQPASSETLDLRDSSPRLRNIRRIDRDAPILNGQHSGPVHPGFGSASMSPENIYRGPIRSPERGWPQTGRYAESVQSDQAYSLAGSGRRYPGSDDRTFVGDGQQGSQYTQQQRPPFSRPINSNDSLWPPDYGGLQRTGLRDLATSTDTNAAAAAAAPPAPAPAPAPTLAPATAAQVTNRTIAVATSASANSSTSDSSVDSVMHQTEDNTLRQVFGKFLELYREEQGTLKQQ